MDLKRRVELSLRGISFMAHDDIKARLTSILQRIELNKYNGVRMDPDFIYLAEKMPFLLDQNDLLLQAYNCSVVNSSNDVVDHFRHPAPADSF